MSKIYKTTTYFLDVNESYKDENSIIAELDNYFEVHPRIISSECKEFEWDDDVIINKLNCTDKQYEEFYNNLSNNEVNINKIQSRILERPNNNPITLKFIEDKNFRFNYGYVEVSTRSWISKPSETFAFNTVISIDVSHKVKNFAGDEYFQIFILYKKYDENKQKYVLDSWKGNLEDWKLKILYKGDAGINL